MYVNANYTIIQQQKSNTEAETNDLRMCLI